MWSAALPLGLEGKMAALQAALEFIGTPPPPVASARTGKSCCCPSPPPPPLPSSHPLFPLLCPFFPTPSPPSSAPFVPPHLPTPLFFLSHSLLPLAPFSPRLFLLFLLSLQHLPVQHRLPCFDCCCAHTQIMHTLSLQSIMPCAIKT